MKPVPLYLDERRLKRRPLKLVRWIELILGIIPPTIFLVPFLVTVILLGTSSGSFGQPAILISLLGIGAVFSLWMLIFFGPDQINERPLFRWFVLWTGVPGLLLCGYMIVYFLMGGMDFTQRPGWDHLLKEPLSLDWKTIVRADDGRLVTAGLIGPFFVGLRYLPTLFR